MTGWTNDESREGRENDDETRTTDPVEPDERLEDDAPAEDDASAEVEDGFDEDEAQTEIDAELDGGPDATDEPEPASEPEPAADTSEWTAPEPESDYEYVPAFLADPPASADSADSAADDQATAVLPAVVVEDDSPATEVAVIDAHEVEVFDEAVVDGTEPEPESRKVHWGRWALVLGAVVLLGGYAAAAYVASERVPAGTTVLGIDVGGKSRDEAVDALQPAVDELNATPVTLTSEDRTTTIDPTDSGLVAGAGATVDELISFSLNPYDVLRSFTGREREIDVVTVVDDEALVASIEVAGTDLEVDGEDATVTIADTGASATPAVDGVAVDAEETAAGLGDAWPIETYEAVTTTKPAAITTETADEFVSELNAEILAGDVEMTGPNGDATVTADQLTRLGSVDASEGELSLVIDGATLAAELESADPELVSAATSASFSFDSKHNIKVKKAKPGKAIDGDSLGPAVVAAAMTAERAGELPYKNTEAAVTNDDLGVTDFKEKVASFDTPLTNEPVRTQNLVVGARKVTGTVVKPDETFSLLDTLAPITAEGGYQAAHVIVDGFLTDGIGGGLSQMATTTYNAGYFAGLEDVEHRPHSKWFERYPAGREATIYVGSLDMRFKNNTPYALVMNSYVEGGRLHVDIWSTKYFTVKTYASDKTNFVQPKQVENSRSDCIATPAGNPGFTITNTREVLLDGEQVDKSSYTWTYQPSDGVTCTADDDD